MKFFCLKCGKEVEGTNVQEAETRKNTVRYTGKCSVCGSKLSRFAQKPKCAC